MAAAVVAAALGSQAAHAQTRRPAAAPPAKSRATAQTAPKEPTRTPDTADTASDRVTAIAGAAAETDAGVVEATTLDGGTRVFKFSALDIEGRLRSPQLVYFLRRVRAEFAAGDLGHRSFLREMSETRKESTF